MQVSVIFFRFFLKKCQNFVTLWSADLAEQEKIAQRENVARAHDEEVAFL